MDILVQRRGAIIHRIASSQFGADSAIYFIHVCTYYLGKDLAKVTVAQMASKLRQKSNGDIDMNVHTGSGYNN